MTTEPPARFHERKYAAQRERVRYQKKVQRRHKQLKGYANAMKRRMTNPEYRLWQIIKHWHKPFRPHRQEIISCYIADFAFRRRKVVIEVDGPDHRTALGRWKDRKRTDVLEVLGWRVMRLTNEEIMENELQAAGKVRVFLGASVIECPPAPFKYEEDEDPYAPTH
jgi:5-methyltetrahydrofolate--homocysteine methyltransferase/ATP-dependent DNA helicase RecG/methylmalonyl-CoA mutase